MSGGRKTVQVTVGNVAIGGDEPIVVQSMTNTDTADVGATVRQVRELAAAGSEIVRITVNSNAAARSVGEIVRRLRGEGNDVPIVGDFHYNGHLLLSRHPDCARALSKFRINPGNVGKGRYRDQNFRRLIQLALEYDKPVRIGVNWGSLDQDLLSRLMEVNAARAQPASAAVVLEEAIVASALESAELAREYGLPKNRIILSAKVSSAPELIRIYRVLGRSCDYPLHLGLTEAGMGSRGIVASSAALGVLLHDGIGETIRVSLTPLPGASRAEEVRVAQQILQSLGLRSFTPQVSACPGCGRTTSSFFQELAEHIERHLRLRMVDWKKLYPGVEDLKVAVMGCIVNGPGESKHADIGISLPGSGEEPKAPVYVDGRQFTTLRGDGISDRFIRILEDYVTDRYGASREVSRSAGLGPN